MIHMEKNLGTEKGFFSYFKSGFRAVRDAHALKRELGANGFNTGWTGGIYDFGVGCPGSQIADVNVHHDREYIAVYMPLNSPPYDSFMSIVQAHGFQVVNKPATQVAASDKIELISDEQYVSRAGLKLASVANKFKLD